METPWIKWTDRKPKEGEPIIAMYVPCRKRESYGYHTAFMGDAIINLIVKQAGEEIDLLYWLPLPPNFDEL